MRKVLLILMSIAILSGCKSDSPLSFSKISKKSLNKDIYSFLQNVKEENGVHLYFDKQNEAIIVYLNESSVVQGEKAIYFTSFDVEEDNDTLNILYKSDETSDYSNSTLEHELLYKVNLNKKYESVRLFNNDSETSFGKISGNL